MADHGLDALSQADLRRLRSVVRRMLDAVVTEDMRIVAAMLNEIDARIDAQRGPRLTDG